MLLVCFICFLFYFGMYCHVVVLSLCLRCLHTSQSLLSFLCDSCSALISSTCVIVSPPPVYLYSPFSSSCSLPVHLGLQLFSLRFSPVRRPVWTPSQKITCSALTNMNPKEMKKCEEALENNDAPGAAARIRRYLENQNDIPLNIAVTGETGAGKSTFVNAFRGIDNDDERAAPTGCTETTMEPTEYPHPKYPNVILWDLPGIGTTNFTAHEYLKKVGFKKFDFFIIISAGRFRENDVKLALEIQKMKKKFYFVRSKIDTDLQNEKRKKTFNEENTLDSIKEDCIQGLQKQGIEDPKVFLVSSFELHLYDFSLLHETLERELPDLKKDALLFAMLSISREIINKKKEAFQAQIKYRTSLSALAAGVPIPGLSTGVDLSMMAAVISEYVDGFGLDKSSLQRLADSTGVPYEDLHAVIKSPLALNKVNKELLLPLITQIGSTGLLIAVEEGLRFIPLIGFIAAASLSFTATYNILNVFLNELADDAHRVFEKALGLDTSV